VRRDHQRFFLRRLLETCQRLRQPFDLLIVSVRAQQIAGTFRDVGIQANDVHERRGQHPVDPRLGHGFAEDADISGNGRDGGGCGAKIVEEFLQRYRVGARERLTIVVSGNRDDLAGIFHVRPVEFIAIQRSFLVAVNDVSQMHEQCGIVSMGCWVVVGSHGFIHLLLRRAIATRSAGISDDMKFDGAGLLDFIGSRATYDVLQLHHGVSLRRRDRPQFFRGELRQVSRPGLRTNLAVRDRCRGEKRVGVSQRR
jgi:hypothetical protein